MFIFIMLTDSSESNASNTRVHEVEMVITTLYSMNEYKKVLT